jgi:hypothetical protein
LELYTVEFLGKLDIAFDHITATPATYVEKL